MLGLMQDWPLTVDRILDHAAHRHGTREIVSRSVEGPVVRTTYAELHGRAKQVSHGLRELGIARGDRVATLAWNSARHMEVWYGIMGIGAVCHTLNPRLHPDQLCWIIQNAGDQVILADIGFAPMLLAALATRETPVERLILLSDEAHRPPQAGPDVLMYEDWLAGRPATDAAGAPAWGRFGEETACGLCYTSGTTGDPKGVLYSHRSNFLHTFLILQADIMGLSAADVILPIVPMFHANAWGVAFAAPAVGAKMVMPGSRLDGASVHELLETEGVTFSAAVPTVWQGLLQHLDATGGKLTTLKRVVIGGSACPEVLLRRFWDDYGVEVRHAWGMTETSPVGTMGAPDARAAALPFAEQLPWRMKQGRPPLGIELKLVDDGGAEVAEDGVSVGRLMVRGPTVARGYFARDGEVLDADGFFDTGDIASIDPHGVMQITDRAKDVIKSGGEWISSIEIENIATSHPGVAMAAVVGVAHPKWDERPLLLVQLKPGATADGKAMQDHLSGRIAKWWMPDDVVFLDEIPLGATGKVDKKALRAKFAERYAATELSAAG
ncbi:long-chain-fatty-acid--CoA ligase [Caulobacter sp. S45]|uniref:long-chain-fatty-acid--CoA ligase n=1 Tax=Caulobacter sp. S45 TaxID=1641861 RepID=UPI0015753098|nr:long-chain-fatty-acid--CoA ligase [Caulobacter sp. S45]